VSTTLPIDEHLDRITAAVAEAGGAVIVAEPGAGKTTRVPSSLLDATGREVICTQPRRIAARLSAKRVAEERKSPLGHEVGYEVRFDRKISKETRLRFVTEGMALRQWASQTGTNRILVLDEFHERHLDADMLLALAAAEREANPDLAIVVMSATLDPKRVSDFLGGLPIFASDGRNFPVDLEYQVPRDKEFIEVGVSRALRQILKDQDKGDVLVFLPGLAEIRRCEDKLKSLAQERSLLLTTLHGSLPPSEQDQALKPSAKRKVILSTNVAETSVTIEGVTAVIDSGTARVARHSPWTGLSSLQVEVISQASAKQRAGRAGRTCPGRCVRLYSEHELKGRRAFDTPEIARSDLADCVLTLAASGRSFESVRWLDPAPTKALFAATELLTSLGAIDASGVTEVGRRMSDLPVHPRLARLVLEADALGVLAMGTTAAALLSHRALRHGQRRGQEAEATSASDLQDDIDILQELRRGKFRANLARSAGVDLQTAKNVERSSEQLRKSFRGPSRAAPLGPQEQEEALRRALLAAFPDRACRRVRPRSESLLLARGGAVTQSRSSAVLDAEYLLAIDVEARSSSGSGKGTLVRVASAIDPLWLLDLVGIRDVDEHHYESEGQRVIRRTGIYYGDFAIDEEYIVDPNRLDAEAASEALLAALLDGQLNQVVDRSELDAYRRRLAFVSPLREDLNFPSYDDEAVARILLSMANKATRLSDLRSLALVDGMHWALSEEQRQALDAMAPSHVSIPGRKRVLVNYESDRPPWIQSRLQDFFGAQEGPSVGGGTVPITLHLLAPNRRAVQVTTDLAGFWVRHYPALRKQLMRRYPRHSWPEKP
jgi:ATP-dependent helicase HrpB